MDQQAIALLRLQHSSEKTATCFVLPTIGLARYAQQSQTTIMA